MQEWIDLLQKILKPFNKFTVHVLSSLKHSTAAPRVFNLIKHCCSFIKHYITKKSTFLSLRLCKSYDEISDKVQEMPDNTSDLVALTQFLENASSVTVVNLQTAVDEAGERLLFLLDYATLPCKWDIITPISVLLPWTISNFKSLSSKTFQHEAISSSILVCFLASFASSAHKKSIFQLI